jgi:hypothetical protein
VKQVYTLEYYGGDRTESGDHDYPKSPEGHQQAKREKEKNTTLVEI